MFEVAIEAGFCATHRLVRNGQPLEPVHGHDWKVEVVAKAETLDASGVAVGFEALQEALRQVVATFHYGDLNTHPGFVGRSPSAEAVAQYVFAEVRKRMGPEGERLWRVRVWEAPGCSAAYAP